MSCGGSGGCGGSFSSGGGLGGNNRTSSDKEMNGFEDRVRSKYESNVDFLESSFRISPNRTTMEPFRIPQDPTPTEPSRVSQDHTAIQQRSFKQALNWLFCFWLIGVGLVCGIAYHMAITDASPLPTQSWHD